MSIICPNTVVWGDVGTWVSGIGSLGAVVAAVWISLSAARRAQNERVEVNHVILHQMYAEISRIRDVCHWCLDLNRKIREGYIPQGFDAALDLALHDVAELGTPIFDRFGHHSIQFKGRMAGFLLLLYTQIRTQLSAIERILERQSEDSLQNQFDKIMPALQKMYNTSSNVISDLGSHLGIRENEYSSPGMESYTVFALAKDSH